MTLLLHIKKNSYTLEVRNHLLTSVRNILEKRRKPSIGKGLNQEFFLKRKTNLNQNKQSNLNLCCLEHLTLSGVKLFPRNLVLKQEKTMLQPIQVLVILAMFSFPFRKGMGTADVSAIRLGWEYRMPQRSGCKGGVPSLELHQEKWSVCYTDPPSSKPGVLQRWRELGTALLQAVDLGKVWSLGQAAGILPFPADKAG